MKKLIFFVLIILFFQSNAIAFILPSSKIFEFMEKERNKLSGVKVSQTTFVYDDALPQGKLEALSTLYLKKPDKFYLENKFSNNTMTVVANGSQVVTLVDNKIQRNIIGIKEDLILRDLILCPSSSKILGRLKEFGIDTNSVGFGRANGIIVYIIGAKRKDNPLPQIWIDKERFIPIKLIAMDKENSRWFEIEFLDYRLVDGFWYPFIINFFSDKKLVQTFIATDIFINSQISDHIFDVENFKKLSPSAVRQKGKTE